MKSPKITAIIPNFNHAKFLRQRIDSVLNQTYRDFEVIILDDCSSDNSREIIEEYRTNEKVSHTVFNETNSGSTFKQWNRGVKLASGEYIWLAESDDFADKRFLEEMMPCLQENPNVGIAKCRSFKVDGDGNILDLVEKNRPRDWSKSFVISGKEDCLRQLEHGISIYNASATLIRKSTYEEIGLADESYRMAGDWDTWIRILNISDFAYLSMPLNYMRQMHGDTARATHVFGHTGIHELEDIRVASALFNNLNPAAVLKRKMLRKLVRNWVFYCITLRGKRKSLKTNISIIRSLWRLSPYTVPLMAKYMLIRPVNAVARRISCSVHGTI